MSLSNQVKESVNQASGTLREANQVKESVNQASGTLREALAFAARTEHPVVISSLTDILVRLESLEHMDELMDKFGKQRDLPTSLG